MQHHITITKVWSDDDCYELALEVCDGTSRFVNRAYVAHDWFASQASALAQFSHRIHGGIHDLEAGKAGPEWANGTLRARFHYHTPRTLFVSTYQQSDHFDFKSNKVAAEATLYLRTEPALLDEFIAALATMDRKDSHTAVLRCVPLGGA